jgi:hypothetical protein
MEMFLIRLLYLKEDKIVGTHDRVDFNNEKYSNNNVGKTEQFNLNKEEDGLEIKNKTISQIKNFFQEESPKPEKKIEPRLIKNEIKNFEQLIKLCNEKKELKLKYRRFSLSFFR